MVRSRIVVKCKQCTEHITAKNSKELLHKKKRHKLSCHIGFEEVHNNM